MLIAALLFGGAAKTFSQTPSLVWQKTYGGPKPEYGLCSARLGPNLFVHGGKKETPAGGGIMLLFTDANGDSLYSRVDTTFYTGKIYSIAANDDGSFVGCGYYGKAGLSATFLIKFNQFGTIIWQKDFNIGSSANNQEVIRVPDGSYWFPITRLILLKLT